mgnify:CR=1 FL=1
MNTRITHLFGFALAACVVLAASAAANAQQSEQGGNPVVTASSNPVRGILPQTPGQPTSMRCACGRHNISVYPGSFRTFKEVFYDSRGSAYLIRGCTWNSLGKPHRQVIGPGRWIMFPRRGSMPGSRTEGCWPTGKAQPQETESPAAHAAEVLTDQIGQIVDSVKKLFELGDR